MWRRRGALGLAGLVFLFSSTASIPQRVPGIKVMLSVSEGLREVVRETGKDSDWFQEQRSSILRGGVHLPTTSDRIQSEG